VTEPDFEIEDDLNLGDEMLTGTAQSFELLFRKTGNPIFAWAIWILFRDPFNRRPPPDWVLQYIDQACATIFDAVAINEKIPNPAERAGVAFGFKAPAKGSNPFAHFKRLSSGARATEQFARLLRQKKGLSSTKAYELVAAKMKLTPATAKRLIGEFCALTGTSVPAD